MFLLYDNINKDTKVKNIKPILKYFFSFIKPQTNMWAGIV